MFDDLWLRSRGRGAVGETYKPREREQMDFVNSADDAACQEDDMMEYLQWKKGEEISELAEG